MAPFALHSSDLDPDRTRALGTAAIDLLARAPFPVVIHDLDLVVTGWNEGAARCFEFAEEEALGKRIDDLFLAEDRIDAWREALVESGAPRIFECAQRGGDTVPCEWRYQAASGERAAEASWICMAQPMPSKSALAPSLDARILRAVLDTLPMSVWAVDREGDYVFHDGLGVELAGMKRGDLLGQNLWELWKGVPGTVETLQQVRVAMDSKQGAHAYAEAMGRAWETWCMPITSERGEVEFVASVTMDITDSKRAESELREKLELIKLQERLIHALAAPIIEVWDGVLTVPLVGIVDSSRATELMDQLLREVVRKRARYAILDLTGVDTVETQTAAYLINLVRAVRLLGAAAIITGIRPTVAQTIVSLDADLSEVPIRSNLRSGLDYCMRQISSGARPATRAPRRA
jgi:rsbT co-antagonist protein RsbR